MCCPLQSKKLRIEQFNKYTGMVRFYIRNLRIFRETHPDAKACDYFSSEYEQFAYDVFYHDISINKFKQQVFEIDWKKALEEYFKIKL